MSPRLRKGHAYGLKFTRADGDTDGNKGRPVFRWPLTVGATVMAPDWRDDTRCGGGLHFFAWGEGDSISWPIDDAAHGLVIDYVKKDARDCGGKHKVDTCTIVFVGTPREAAAWLSSRYPTRRVILGTATAGDAGTATAGDAGTATAGARGTATAGDAGTATAGYAGTATAGDDGVLSILWWDGAASRYRRQVAVVDGITIKPWRRYTLDATGQWVEGAEVPESERPAAVSAAAHAKAGAK